MNKVEDYFDEILLSAIKEPSKRYYFYKAFLELELVVIGTVLDNVADSEMSNNEEPTLNLKYIQTEEELFLPVFTSWEKFNSIMGPNCPYIKIPSSMLLDVVEPNIPWMLNPGCNLGKKLITEELETLKDGRILHYFFEQLDKKEKEQLMAEQIVDFPETSFIVLRTCLQEFYYIMKAYLINIYNPSASEPLFPLLGIEIDVQDQGELLDLVNQLNKKVNQQLQVQPQIEVMVLDEILPLTNSIVDHTKPFYIRETQHDLESMFK